MLLTKLGSIDICIMAKSKIEKKILQEITKSDSEKNFGEIIKLSHQLSEKQEVGTVRFTTDAGIINRLGKELVARQETAVVELIKNSYDADASLVELVFSNTATAGGTLEIIDDGHGMDKEDLIRGFMTLSSNNKVNNPTSPRYGRTRAGKKGIGRFATQRLGEVLEIYTKTIEDKEGKYVKIEWDKFIPGKELILVKNSIEETKIETNGTRLVISGLRENWSNADIKRVFRYISDILQPFPISVNNKAKNGFEVDPGFNVHMFKGDDDDLELVADEQSQILEYSLAIVEGKVDQEGNGEYSVSSRLYDLAKENFNYTVDGKKSSFDELYNINFKAYYFTQPQDEQVYPKNLKKHINNILRHKGGIRIYRNGFRVPPYGGIKDDWLGLAESTAKRKVLPPHSNSNWIGIVEIVDLEGDQFEEKSSREGLIENNAFKELQEFLYKALTDTAIAVAIAREKKITASQKNWNSDYTSEGSGETVKKVSSELDEIFKEEKKNKGEYKDDTKRKYNQKRKEQLLKTLSSIALKLINENAMLRVLASTGITVSEFIHEIHQTIGIINANVFHLKRLAKNNEELEEYIDALDLNTKRFVSYIDYFSQTIRENIVRELKPIELGEVVHRFVTSTKPLALQRGVKIDSQVKGFDLFTKEMHESEWSSILSNLYSNSIKAIKRAGVEGEILITVSSKKNNLLLSFQDNGDGISENLSGDIFEPFITISSTNRSDKYRDDQSGLGLGLKIVRDTLNSYGGTIEVVEPDKGFSTRFNILIPKMST